VSDPAPHTNHEPGMPRWVKVMAVVAVLVVLVFIILVVAGRGRHGPGRHLQSASWLQLPREAGGA
jgi:hypothetical protein